jgi:hypothetical protein
MNRYLLPGGVFLLLVIVLYIGIQRAPQKTVIPSALLGKPDREVARIPTRDRRAEVAKGKE